MSFDIRRATKDQLDKINAEIKAGKSGKNYTIHQSGGLDFILTEKTGVESEEDHVEDGNFSGKVDPQPQGFESPDVQEPLEFNFGP